jgi:uncharacterized membrane protein YgaE (UPF0421/DUF939 family)
VPDTLSELAEALANPIKYQSELEKRSEQLAVLQEDTELTTTDDDVTNTCKILLVLLGVGFAFHYNLLSVRILFFIFHNFKFFLLSVFVFYVLLLLHTKPEYSTINNQSCICIFRSEKRGAHP